MSNLSTCSEHQIHNENLIGNIEEIANDMTSIQRYYTIHHRLPCYILDYVGNDREMIKLCKRFGATCCAPNRSNLARRLLGVPCINFPNNQHKIKNKFDRAIHIGLIKQVKALIWNNLAISENITLYDTDVVVQDYLRVQILTYFFSHTNIPNCLCDIIIAHFDWDNVRHWYHKPILAQCHESYEVHIDIKIKD